jgi:hypothetical protein
MTISVSITHNDIGINHAWRYRYQSRMTISVSITYDDIGINHPWWYWYQLPMMISVSITHDDIGINHPWRYRYQSRMTISVLITHDDIVISYDDTLFSSLADLLGSYWRPGLITLWYLKKPCYILCLQTPWRDYVPFIVITLPSFLYPWLIEEFVTRVIPRCISGAKTIYPTGTPEEHLFFREVLIVQALVFYVLFYRSVFVHLSFFFWPLLCLSFLDIWILIQTFFAHLSTHVLCIKRLALHQYQWYHLARFCLFYNNLFFRVLTNTHCGYDI